MSCILLHNLQRNGGVAFHATDDLATDDLVGVDLWCQLGEGDVTELDGLATWRGVRARTVRT